MKLNSRYQVALFAVAVFIVLFLHDSNLYPQLSNAHRFVLSSLRFTLLAGPVLLSVMLKHTKLSSVRAVISVALALFIPYTLYSVTEIRHITELCPVHSVTYFTDSCSLSSWKLLPPIVYAMIGIAVYGVCLQQLNVRRMRWWLGLFVLYIALASQFALQSRLNIWNIATQPADVLNELIKAATAKEFWLNSGAYFLFFMAITAVITHSVNNMAFKQK